MLLYRLLAGQCTIILCLKPMQGYVPRLGPVRYFDRPVNVFELINRFFSMDWRSLTIWWPFSHMLCWIFWWRVALPPRCSQLKRVHHTSTDNALSPHSLEELFASFVRLCRSLWPQTLLLVASIVIWVCDHYKINVCVQVLSTRDMKWSVWLYSTYLWCILLEISTAKIGDI